MPIQIYDSQARAVVPLSTREPPRLYMYVCGPTVYNYIHIGNARTFVWFDFIRRYLSYRGFDVTYVMNYTDVDDKIIERARLEGIPADGIAAKYARAFEDDMGALGVTPPDILSLATDHVEDMVLAIEGLVEKGFAYEAEGNVFFDVEKFNGYGKLSGRSLEDLRAGERVEPQAAKRNPLDFTLWKSAKEGEPSWSSPWGPGRPGWHIECSVMSTKYLGMGFDIHGGATDLIFPHHENEIAQAEALDGSSTFARHWLHAGLVQMEAEKMSKSLGNFVLARDVVATYPGEALRYWALAGSYRTQVVFSPDTLEDASHGYERWRTFLDSARHALGPDAPSLEQRRRPLDADVDAGEAAGPYIQRFLACLDDDFNSAGAFAAVHDLVREGNSHMEATQRGDDDAASVVAELLAAFLELTSVLGLSFAGDVGASELTGKLIEYLLELREEARGERAFDKADAIRATLINLGVAVEDTAAGPRWRLGRTPAS